MATDIVKNFIFSRSAIARSRRTVYAGSVVLFAVITAAFANMLIKLLHDRPGMDVNGKMLVAALMIMIALLWAFCVGAIAVATVRNRQWFAQISGALSFAPDSLYVGSLKIERSSIVSSKKTRRHLLIRYRSDGKPCRVALPLTWLPVGAADDILQSIENKDG